MLHALQSLDEIRLFRHHLQKPVLEEKREKGNENASQMRKKKEKKKKEEAPHKSHFRTDIETISKKKTIKNKRRWLCGEIYGNFAPTGTKAQLASSEIL